MLGAQSHLRPRRRPLHLNRLVERLESLLGRHARPFRLRLVEVPVAATDGWWLCDDLALVSGRLVGDDAAFEKFLESALARMA